MAPDTSVWQPAIHTRPERNMTISRLWVNYQCAELVPRAVLSRSRQPVKTDSRQPQRFFREVNAFLIMLKFSDSYETYRICSQQYLHSIWIVFGCMGCWGVGWGGAEPVKTDSRRTHVRSRLPSADALVCLQLNTYLMMLEYSDSYETYRICLQQYLDSIWIVLGCMGCLGWGGGDKPVKTDSRRIRADALKYILNDVRIFRQLLKLQDMFTTIFTFDLNSFWVYGVLGGGGWGGGGGGGGGVPTSMVI